MGVLAACFFVIKGGRTSFDQLLGILGDCEEEVVAADIPVEVHEGDGLFVEGHLHDRKGELLLRLEEAKERVDEIWYLVLEAKELVE